jgi:hypothetical protein
VGIVPWADDLQAFPASRDTANPPEWLVAGEPVGNFPYNRDDIHMMAVGKEFYGVLPANNPLDPAKLPVLPNTSARSTRPPGPDWAPTA